MSEKYNHSQLNKNQQAALPSAWFLTDDNRINKPEDIIKTLPRDCGVIMRDYRLDPIQRRNRAETIASQCQQDKRPFLIAGDPDLAKAVAANGVHLSEKILYRFDLDDMPDYWMITASCHGLSSLSHLNHPRLSALFVSPIFPTKSHIGETTLGLAGLEDIARASHKPIYALGGVTRENFKQLNHIPQVKGYAAISDFL